MARLILVHGAFGRREVWTPAIPGLEAAGNTVEAITLPGQGDDPTPLSEVSLDAYANRIIEQLRSRPGQKAILVAHSMGGMSVTQAASRVPELIEALIYVSSFMPDDGESLVDLTNYPEAAGDMIQANLQVAGDPPVGTMSDEATAAAVFNCCTPEQVKLALSLPRRQPVIPMTQPFVLDQARREEFEALPRRYVTCLQDNCIRPAMQRLMYERAGAEPVISIDPDHAPFLSRTSELVAALNELAALGDG